MIHIAYMKKSWGMIPRILNGEKTIESRWYKTKRAPWGKITAGETVYFKNSGESVTVKATVAKVLQFKNLNPEKIRGILEKFGKEDGIEKEKIPFFAKLFTDKKYCILIFLKNPKKVQPFEINKKGFGAMCAWITANKLDRLMLLQHH